MSCVAAMSCLKKKTSNVVVSLCVFSIAGGKTPDATMRRYADIMMETKLKNEEVGICTKCGVSCTEIAGSIAAGAS